MAIKIIIDSASDITPAEAVDMGITLIPMTISFGTDIYLDGIELSQKEFYEKLIECDTLPKTSLIGPQSFEEAFTKATQNGDEVIAITISSKLSGTYSSAVKAASKFGGKVKVIDSMNASMGERLVCEHVLKLIKQGKSAEEICEAANKAKSKICVLALLNTLKYLKKGGRISSAAAFVGELISIKPVIAIENGEVKLVGKAKGSKNGNNLLTALIDKKGGIDFSMPFGAMWSGMEKSLLEKYITDSENLWKQNTETVPSHRIGPTIGTHIGPGGIGVAFFSK